MNTELAEALKEISELRSSILNIEGDNLCWIHDPGTKIPPQKEFLESCRRFHGQMASIRGVLEPGSKTIAQLEREATELRVALRESLKLQAHYGRLLNQHDGGERLIFDSMDEWLNRIREIRSEIRGT